MGIGIGDSTCVTRLSLHRDAALPRPLCSADQFCGTNTPAGVCAIGMWLPSVSCSVKM